MVWKTSNRERMSQILKAYDAHLVHPHLPQDLPAALASTGFSIDREGVKIHCICNTSLSSDPLVPESPDTYSKSLISAIEKFVRGRFFNIAESEVAAWKEELFQLDRENKYFFSLNRYLFIVHKQDTV